MFLTRLSFFYLFDYVIKELMNKKSDFLSVLSIWNWDLSHGNKSPIKIKVFIIIWAASK